MPYPIAIRLRRADALDNLFIHLLSILPQIINMDEKEIYEALWMLSKRVIAMEQLILLNPQLKELYLSYLHGDKIGNAINEDLHLRDMLDNLGVHLDVPEAPPEAPE